MSKDPNYDKTKHSLNKLGYIGSIPVLPFPPIAAQMTKGFGGPRVHYMMDASGVYLNGPLPSLPPSKIKEALAAIKASPKEASYSGTGTDYHKLTITTDPAHADRFLIVAGTVILGYGLIDPSAEIVSGDENDEGTPVQTDAAPEPAAPVDPGATPADPVDNEPGDPDIEIDPEAEAEANGDGDQE